MKDSVWYINAYGQPAQVADIIERIYLKDAFQTSTSNHNSSSTPPDLKKDEQRANNPIKNVKTFNPSYDDMSLPFTCNLLDLGASEYWTAGLTRKTGQVA